jgi:transposase
MKYEEEFKLATVERYLQGTDGYERFAKKCGLAKHTLRIWVLRYRKHGAAGLARKTGRYDADFKMSVIRHMWENALSYTQAAAVFNVRNVSSVAAWERRYRDGGALALDPPRKISCTGMQAPTSKPDPLPEDDKRSREDLLKELEYLRMENAYLKKVDALVQAKQNSNAQKKRK